MPYKHPGSKRGRARTWTRAELNALVPSIAWDEPVLVSRILFPDAEPRYACRVCIAERGLKGAALDRLPTDYSTVKNHIDREHK